MNYLVRLALMNTLIRRKKIKIKHEKANKDTDEDKTIIDSLYSGRINNDENSLAGKDTAEITDENTEL